MLQLSLALTALYVADIYTYDACLTRTFRTFYAGLATAVDYKLNFRENPIFADSLEEVHARNARRLFHLLSANGGLYIKLGQAIAMQSAVLPPEFQKMFSTLFDDAPHNSWDEVRRVIRDDFGREVEDVFGVEFDLDDIDTNIDNGKPRKGRMERDPRASASVAQVHWARLADGREVAIKIQKREIARQIGWDLWAFKVVTNIYSYWFDLPFNTLVPFISERLFLETDFENEANNSERMRELVAGEPRLRGKVYIPKVYKDLSSRRVLTAEWIEGAQLWDKKAITSPWHGGWRSGSPGAGGAALPDLSTPPTDTQISDNNVERLKPARDSWRTDGGLGLRYKPIMETMVSLFSAQMFLWGFCHIDPHPGNIFIRRLPSGQPELVLIDHGLYLTLTPEFRHQYARFWKALMTFDNGTIADITRQWGINNPDLFASATLMKPYTGGDSSTSRSMRESLSQQDRNKQSYELQMKVQKGVRQILGDGDKFPQELIFLGRQLRIIQGNNQFLGSPVNRIKITGLWASRALSEDRQLTTGRRWSFYASHLLFRAVLLGTDVVFWISRFRQLLGLGGGMDDDLEKSMVKMAKVSRL